MHDMFLGDVDIRSMVERGLLVRDLLDKDAQIQQCGIDLTVGKVFTFNGDGILAFSNEKRRLPSYKEMRPNKEQWLLEPGTYHFAMNETIELPNNIAGLLLPRSSALSCGITIHSAVWDPGYQGRSFMHAMVARRVKLFRNARVAQMVFLRSGDTAGYNGAYKGEDILTSVRRGA